MIKYHQYIIKHSGLTQRVHLAFRTPKKERKQQEHIHRQRAGIKKSMESKNKYRDSKNKYRDSKNKYRYSKNEHMESKNECVESKNEYMESKHVYRRKNITGAEGTIMYTGHRRWWQAMNNWVGIQLKNREAEDNRLVEVVPTPPGAAGAPPSEPLWAFRVVAIGRPHLAHTEIDNTTGSSYSVTQSATSHKWQEDPHGGLRFGPCPLGEAGHTDAKVTKTRILVATQNSCPPFHDMTFDYALVHLVEKVWHDRGGPVGPGDFGPERPCFS
ncbi:hypothetical protein BDV93DRAFT_509862 [Ceratobasidium sp. AG-I]|nr:hypothetical protein BDV93DRAFT_509862 [Ceratobasidium sp. AG-I]